MIFSELGEKKLTKGINSEEYAKSKCVCFKKRENKRRKSVLAYLASSADFLSVRIRFLGKFPIDLGGRELFLKFILSRKNVSKKSNDIFFDLSRWLLRVPV